MVFLVDFLEHLCVNEYFVCGYKIVTLQKRNLAILRYVSGNVFFTKFTTALQYIELLGNLFVYSPLLWIYRRGHGLRRTLKILLQYPSLKIDINLSFWVFQPYDWWFSSQVRMRSLVGFWCHSVRLRLDFGGV